MIPVSSERAARNNQQRGADIYSTAETQQNHRTAAATVSWGQGIGKRTGCRTKPAALIPRA